MEYVYFSKQSMKAGGQNREYIKLLFAYSGWRENHVIFFENGEYFSGAIEKRSGEEMEPLRI